MTEITNPAKRLYDIIKEISQNSDRMNTRPSIARVFSIEDQNDEAILRVLADIIKLTNDVKNIITSQDSIYEKEAYIRHVDNTYRYIVAMMQSIEGKAHSIGSGTLEGLLGCSNIVRAYGINAEECVEKDVLLEIRNDAKEFLEKLINSEIDKTLKEVLIRNIENLRRAVLEYSLHGVDGILRAINLGIAELSRIKDILLKDDKNQEAGRVFYDLLIKWDHRLVRYSPYFAYIPLVSSGVEYIRGLLQGPNP